MEPYLVERIERDVDEVVSRVEPAECVGIKCLGCFRPWAEVR